jgi:hypothetical protein
MSEKYGADGLTVVSVHTPKYDQERERDYVATAARRFALHHPIYLDQDESYFEQLGKGWRPLFYLVDRQGRIRVRHQGELRLDSRSGAELEAELRSLLAEPGA